MRRVRICITALLLFLSTALPAQEADDVKREVLILTTGGTIASRTDAPMIDGHALVRAVPLLETHARIDVE